MNYISRKILVLIILIFIPAAAVAQFEIVSVTAEPVSCNEGDDGKITITISGGSPPYTYQFFNSTRSLSGSATSNEQTYTFENLMSGYHVVFVNYADSNEDPLSQPVTVSQPDPLTINFTPDPAAVCENSDLLLNANPAGGNGGYIHEWSGPDIVYLDRTDIADPVFTPEATGTFSLTYTVTDARDCSASDDITVTVYEGIEASLSQEDITCFGYDDGSITIGGVTGGSGDYEYTTDGGINWATSPDFSGLSPGTYDVRIRDAISEGCEVILDPALVLSEPEELTADATPHHITCNGADDGSITLDVSGGTEPCSFLWDSGETTQNIENLEPGTYSVTVTDNKGCNTTAGATIEEPDELIAEATPHHITCNGENDGSITLEVSGGTEPYSFLWDSGETTQNIENLEPGTYSVTVTDNNGCNTTAEATVEEPDELVAVATPHHITCNGADDGSITLDVSGGTEPYSFLWDSGETTQNIENLEPGTYSVTLTDNSGCNTTAEATVEEPDELVAEATPHHITCNGESDGSITLEVSGGTEPYSFLWDTGETTQNIEDLAADTYSVTVTDNQGCQTTAQTKVIEPDPIFVSFSAPAITTCYGDPGKIILDAEGGLGTLVYSISEIQWIPGEFQESGTFEDLAGDTPYYGFIKDPETGCLAYANDGNSITINQPSEILYTVTEITDVSDCSYNDNGEIKISAPSGGSSPYSYFINGDSNEGSRTFSDLPAGYHLIEVIDSKGCVKPEEVEVGGPEPLIIEDINVSDITTCYGDETGEIEIIASGGTGSLEYALDEGEYGTSTVFASLPAGEYLVTVRDENLCIAETLVTVDEPDPLQIETEKTDLTCFGSDDGTITINVDGGGEPYEYSVDNGDTYHEENNFTGLAAGTYEIKVMDSGGCAQSGDIISIEEPGQIVITAESRENDTGCPGTGIHTGTITIEASGGTGTLLYSINGGTSFEDNGGNFTELAAGTYNIEVKDQNNCSVSGSTIELINETDPISVETVSVTNASCNKFTEDGELIIEVSGGSGNYTFIWSNGETTRDLTGVGAGDYLLTITDDIGCEYEYFATISHENFIEVTIDAETPVCTGESTLLNTEVTSGSPVSEWLWTSSSGENIEAIPDPVVTPLDETTYTVRATEVNGCYDEYSVVVDVHPLQGISAGNDTTIYPGSTVTLTATGGVFESYSWAPSTGLSVIDEQETEATPPEPILYYVTGITAEGCAETDSVFIDILNTLKPVTGFTPNNDGTNDVWVIENADEYPEIEVEVYNRYGQRVFYSRGYTDDKRWDGTFNGRELPVGTYYYVITVNKGAVAKPLTGPVTIVR